MAHPLATEKIWFDKARVEDAEYNFYARKYSGESAVISATSTLLTDIKNIKDHIRGVLGPEEEEIDMQRLEKLENENNALRELIKSLEARVAKLECSGDAPAAKPAPAAAAPAADDDEDSDIDLFGSDDEEASAEAERVKQERLDAYAAKKSKKPALVAKSNIILDVKPWDDETDLAEMERLVRSIELDGLLWGTSKLVAVGYGIKKLQITTVVEDDKVGTDDLEEKITEFEDFVQSVDIVAFNKI